MGWTFFILISISGVAGIALGPVVGRRARLFILIGGAEAALLGGALHWLAAEGLVQPLDAGIGRLLALALLASAAVLLPFWAGAAWSGH